MKKGWKKSTLGITCEMYQPKTISKKEMVAEGDYPVFGANGIIGKYDKYNHEEEQLLITCRGATCGAVNLSEPKSWINGNAMVIKPKDDVDRNFLEYMFHGYIDLSRIITGSAQPQITRTSLNPVEISYPYSLKEQKAIVKILDQAFAKIDQAKTNIEKNIVNAKELFQSKLNEIFSQRNALSSSKGGEGDALSLPKGWEEKTLSEISIEFGRGKSKHRPRGDASLYGGKFPLIQTGDIGKSIHIIKDFSKTYNEKGLEQSKLWNKGTVCIAIVGANVAETGILNFDSCFPDSVIGIAVDRNKANNEYVEYLLQSYKALLKEKGKGTARDNINMGTFKKLKFPFPKIEKQISIANKLNFLSKKCMKLESILIIKNNELEELKKSILQKAFSGELTKAEVLA